MYGQNPLTVYVFFNYDNKNLHFKAWPNNSLNWKQKKNDIACKTPSLVLESFSELQLRHERLCPLQPCGGEEACGVGESSAHRGRKTLFGQVPYPPWASIFSSLNWEEWRPSGLASRLSLMADSDYWAEAARGAVYRRIQLFLSLAKECVVID